MKNIFKPAIVFLNRLRFMYKFTFILIIISIPIIMLLYRVVSGISGDIDTIKKEQLGAQYNQVLIPLIIDLQQHRGMSSGYLNGDETFKPKIIEKEALIKDKIQKIDNVDKQVGNILLSTGPWIEIKKDWAEIEQVALQMEPSESFDSHTDLIAQAMDLVLIVSDESGLSLDSSLEGYYLVDSITKQLPILTEYLGQARGFATGLLAKGQMSELEHSRLVSMKNYIESSSKSLKTNLEVLNEHGFLSENIKKQGEEAIAVTTKFIDTVNTKVMNDMAIDSSSYFDLATNVISVNVDLLNLKVDALDSVLQTKVDEYEVELLQVTVSTVVVLVFVIYLFLALYFAINDSVIAISRAAGQISEGNLSGSVTVDTKDELKVVNESVNQMLETFRDIIRQNKVVSKQVAQHADQLLGIAEETRLASEQIALASSELATGTDVQTDHIKESITIIDQMVAHANDVNTNVAGIDQSASETSQRATEGGKVVHQTISQMDLTSQTFDNLENSVQQLDKQSSQIGDILNVISNIAEETNLLALNASIEAARAGEHGQGFAVVASEVRKLAEQSKESTKRIGHLLYTIQSGIKDVLNSMNATTKELADSRLQVNTAGQSFADIQSSIQEIVEDINGVKMVTSKLTDSTRLVQDSVTAISEITEETTASTQGVSAASQEQLASMESVTNSASKLAGMSEELNKMVDRYKL